MFRFTEDFSRYDENYKPYGIEIEAATKLWHNHIRPVDGGMAIAACGNKYFLKTPVLTKFSAEYAFSFDFITDFAGAVFYLGYETVGHSGYELVLHFGQAENKISYILRTLKEDRTAAEIKKSVPSELFPASGEVCTVRLCADENKITVQTNATEAVTFTAPLLRGCVGFGRPDFVGEIVVRSATIAAEIETVAVSAPVTVEIPMEEGGTMPLSVTYELYDAAECRYLRATLDGGPQYRSSYQYYNPQGTRAQYNEEVWFIERPYVLFGDQKFLFSMGQLNTSAPLGGPAVLDQYLGMVKFPVTITVPVERKEDNFGFGYEHCRVEGFASQAGKSEYKFTKNGKYLGKTIFPDHFALESPNEKIAVSMIENTVYDAETVREHFRRGHFFAEGEAIEFFIRKHSSKKYLTYEATLQDVFGDTIEALAVDGDLRITHAPLPIGVYRIALKVLYGGETLKSLDAVFEVFDTEGKKCPPLESGLPALFSLPNEQKYLDRDKFDPWSIGTPASSEHYYAITAFATYVAERKRTWEVTKKFGRKWYAWINYRIFGDAEGCRYDKHLDAVRNADYIGYPMDYAFNGSLRCDYMSEYFWNGSAALRGLLDAFLDEREAEGARERVGFARGGTMTQAAVDNLYKFYQHEWYDYARERIAESVTKQNRLLSEINPKWKRSYYGPATIYASMLRSYPLSRSYGFDLSDFLSDSLYTGFAQLEDYPAACAYQTLRGPFCVGTFLAKIPRLVIYPEQYTSLACGCIDGHVKYANPPLGKYEIPLWYSTTQAREYVYNTAVKTKDGYRFWDTYGFMHRDFDEASDDAFIRDWKHIRSHKPKARVKAPILFAEFPQHEDFYETDFVADCGQHVVFNPSEEGVAHLYEVMRLCGLPIGSFAAWDALDTLTAEDTDLLVLPTTVGLSEERLAKLRKLHSEGVSLFAVSRVDGLEDLFGVRYAPESHRMYTLEADGRVEDVYPYTETFLYRSAGAEIKMTASGHPVLLTHGTCALFNLPAYSVGRIHFKEHPYLGRASGSPLYYAVTEQIVRSLTSPMATADKGCGITLTKDEHGSTLLLAIDYSRHDASEIDLPHEYTVMLHSDFKDAVCLDGKPIRRLISENGRLDGLTVTLRRHESALIRLI